MSKKRHFLGQIIYATSPDRKGVDYVIAIFTLRKFLALVAVLDLGQNHVARDYGHDCDVLWDFCLGDTMHGTWV